MDTALAIISLFMSLYGAIIATILGIRELKKEHRQLQLFVDFYPWSGMAKLVIVNTGQRPVFVTGVSLLRFGISPSQGPPVFDHLEPENGELPLLLTDAEQVVLDLGEGAYFFADQAKLVVYDSDGHKYTKYKKRTIDEKYGFRVDGKI